MKITITCLAAVVSAVSVVSAANPKLEYEQLVRIQRQVDNSERPQVNVSSNEWNLSSSTEDYDDYPYETDKIIGGVFHYPRRANANNKFIKEEFMPQETTKNS